MNKIRVWFLFFFFCVFFNSAIASPFTGQNFFEVFNFDATQFDQKQSREFQNDHGEKLIIQYFPAEFYRPALARVITETEKLIARMDINNDLLVANMRPGEQLGSQEIEFLEQLRHVSGIALLLEEIKEKIKPLMQVPLRLGPIDFRKSSGQLIPGTKPSDEVQAAAEHNFQGLLEFPHWRMNGSQGFYRLMRFEEAAIVDNDRLENFF